MARSARERRLAYAAWLSVCFFWGTGYLAYRIGVRSAPPLLFAGLRILAAGLLVVGWSRLRGLPMPRKRDWLPLALVGLLTEGVCNGILAWSAQWLSSGLLAILIATTPFWMVGFDALLPGGERPTNRSVLGLLLGLGGLVWLLAPQLRGARPGAKSVTACFLMQLVCASYAAGSILAKRREVSVGPIVGAGYQMLFAGLAVSLVGLAAGEARRWHLDAHSGEAFLYLLVIGSVVGFGSYIYALRNLPVSLVSLHRFINPVVAVLLGWAVLGERFTGREAAAVATIFLGVALVAQQG